MMAIKLDRAKKLAIDFIVNHWAKGRANDIQVRYIGITTTNRIVILASDFRRDNLMYEITISPSGKRISGYLYKMAAYACTSEEEDDILLSANRLDDYCVPAPYEVKEILL